MNSYPLRLAALAAALIGTAAAPAPEPRYILSVHFEDGAPLSGDPRLEVRLNKPTTIMVGDPARGSLTMHITATSAGGSQLNASFSIDAVPSPGVHKRATSALLVDVGKPATIEFGEQSPIATPVRVSFTFQPL